MSREIIIYCDESTANGVYYSNFYGGALIESTHLSEINNLLNEKKKELNFYKEVKWTKITTNYCDKYISLMEAFFQLIHEGKIKIRIMFTDNRNIPKNLTPYHKDQKYFLLYYQFLKHAFGLQYSNQENISLKLRIYFDRLPDKKEKTALFKSHISTLAKLETFTRAKIASFNEQIAEVESHEHVILQYLDIVLGSMQFRLNRYHLEKCLQTKKRSKRTIAKEKVYKYINEQIRVIYPKFNIGITTGTRGNYENRWLDPYRHWLFTPRAIDDKIRDKK